MSQPLLLPLLHQAFPAAPRSVTHCSTTLLQKLGVRRTLSLNNVGHSVMFVYTVPATAMSDVQSVQEHVLSCCRDCRGSFAVRGIAFLVFRLRKVCSYLVTSMFWVCCQPQSACCSCTAAELCLPFAGLNSSASCIAQQILPCCSSPLCIPKCAFSAYAPWFARRL